MNAVHAGPWSAGRIVVVPGRLIRLEARRNALLLLLPLIAVLFWFDTYRTAMSTPDLWGIRSFTFQRHLLFDFAPFLAGAAAWTGARDSRRDMMDIVSVTSRPRWVSRLAALTATTGWALVGYAVCVAALYGATARQHPPGDPVWWPVWVGALSIVVLCLLGFVGGVLVPGRFAAPMAAIFALLVVEVGARAGAVSGQSPYSLLAPLNEIAATAAPAPDYALLYPYAPDVSIVQMLFLAGIVTLLLGVLGFPSSSGSLRVRGACAVLTVGGLAAACTAVALIGTASAQPSGMTAIGSVHKAAEDRPIGFTPVCASRVVPVCVHPAFTSYLAWTAAAVGPTLNEVAGLPGAPVKSVEIASDYRDTHYRGERITGTPPILELPMGTYVPMTGEVSRTDFVQYLQVTATPLIVEQVIGGGLARPGGAAQQAIELGVLKAAGVPTGKACASDPCVPGPETTKPGAPIYAPALRFAAMSAAHRHSWLAANLPALRAGHITLAHLP